MKHLLYICLIIFLAACTKDTDLPAPPPTPAPQQWLLSKIRISDNNDTAGVIAHEYQYKSGEIRPWLHFTHRKSLYGSRLAGIDTFYYDAQGRLSAVNAVRDTSSSIPGHFWKKIYYAPDGRISYIQTSDYNYDSIAFQYRGDTAIQLGYDKHIWIDSTIRYSFQDSMRYVYDGMSNLQKIQAEISGSETYPYDRDKFTDIMQFSYYDQHPNVLSHLNMNVYLPFMIETRPKGVESEWRIDVDERTNIPFISKNNYGMVQVFSTVDEWRTVYLYDYSQDPAGLIKEVIETSPTQQMRRIRFEYIPAP